jgi:hypothetical protein
MAGKRRILQDRRLDLDKDFPDAAGPIRRCSFATCVSPNNVSPFVGKVACLADLSIERFSN